MAAHRLELSTPPKKVSAWIAETDPKAARQWLDALPMADTAAASQEVYQALYTLNRLEIGPNERFKLMELYREPVNTLTLALQSHFKSAVLPLTAKKRQLAEFIRQLQAEMAYGYKLTIQGLVESRLLWGKNKLNAMATEGALYYLGEVLNKSYQVYMPCPPGVWKEIHALYGYGEDNDWFGESLDLDADPDTVSAPYRRYLRIALLGLCNPYQLSEQEWQHVLQFLDRWADRAAMGTELSVNNPAGLFLVDITSDSPPVSFPKDISFGLSGDHRVLNTLGVSRVIQDFIVRIRKGQKISTDELGMDCLENVSLDMLRKMIRFWGLGVRRKRPRQKAKGISLVAYGINAVHFFGSNQKPFVPPETSEDFSDNPFDRITERLDPDDLPIDTDSVFIDLENPANIVPSKAESQEELTPIVTPRPQEIYRVERWRIEDESINGMLLTHDAPERHRLRVGDVLGVQDVSRDDQWRIGVVRWIKTPSANTIQMGIEMIAPGFVPVAVRMADKPLSAGNTFVQALLLSPVSALKLPASVILPKGLYKPKQALLIAESGESPRKIIVLDALAQTATFDQAVFANAAS